jgi:hypothetical protein
MKKASWVARALLESIRKTKCSVYCSKDILDVEDEIFVSVHLH